MSVHFHDRADGALMVTASAGGVGGGVTGAWSGLATEEHKTAHWREFAAYKAAKNAADLKAAEDAADAAEEAEAAAATLRATEDAPVAVEPDPEAVPEG